VPAEVFDGGQRVEGARYHLDGPGPTGFVTRLGFQQLGIGQDDPQLVVESVEQCAEVGRVVERPRQ